MNTSRTIRTTVVGIYPVPDWLAALPSRQALVDATRVGFKTQETAGVDVVVDGELYRFDVNHPDTNGMIEYFTRPMSGIRSAITRSVIAAFAEQEGMGFRAEPFSRWAEKWPVSKLALKFGIATSSIRRSSNRRSRRSRRRAAP